MTDRSVDEQARPVAAATPVLPASVAEVATPAAATKPTQSASPAATAAPVADGTVAEPAAPARRRRAAPVGLLLLALFVVGLLATTWLDRVVPYTSEATLQAPIVGVAPNVSGTIVQVFVDDNQPVAAEDSIVQIDPQRFEAAFAAAQAALANAVLSVGASSAKLDAAVAHVSDTQATLENQRAQTARTLKLAALGHYSQAQADQARANLTNTEGAVREAEASLAEARLRLGPTNADNPAIKQALANLARARIDLGDTLVKAPVSGMITNTVLAPGQFASAGRRVATIVDTESAWVIANMPENMLGNIAVGDPVLITFNVAPGEIVEGRVASMASGVSQSVASVLEGSLPYVAQRRQWLREVQRIPVRIDILARTDIPVLRVGSRANVVVLTRKAGGSAVFGRAWLRFVSLVDYVF